MAPTPSQVQKTRPKRTLQDFFSQPTSSSRAHTSSSQSLLFPHASQQSKPKPKPKQVTPATQPTSTSKSFKATRLRPAPDEIIIISSDSGSENRVTRSPRRKQATKTAPTEVIVISSSSEGTPPPPSPVRRRSPRKPARPQSTLPPPSELSSLSRSPTAFAVSATPSRKRSHSAAMRDPSAGSSVPPPPSRESLAPVASKQFKLSQNPTVDFSYAEHDNSDATRSGEGTSKPASTSRSPQVKNEYSSPSKILDLASSPHSRVNTTRGLSQNLSPPPTRTSPVSARSSSPPKRASPEHPDRSDSPRSSKKRRLSEGRVESIPPAGPSEKEDDEDDDEVIASSETDEGNMGIDPAKLLPRTTPSFIALTNASLRGELSPDTLMAFDTGNEDSQVFAADTDGSEAQVSRQLEDIDGEPMKDVEVGEPGDDSMTDEFDDLAMGQDIAEREPPSKTVRRSARASAASGSRRTLPLIKEDPPSSDAESVDSEKALQRARNAKLSLEEDDDDDDLDLLDDDLMAPVAKKAPAREYKLNVPNGLKPMTPARKYISPNALPSDHIRRVRLQMESTSPLTPTSSPQKRQASKNPESPTQLRNRPRYMTPSLGQVVVEIPPVPPNVDLSTYVRVSDKLPTPKVRRLPTPSAAGPSKPKPARLPKSAGGTALDGLLKEKDNWDKKYGSLLAVKTEKENGDLIGAGPSGGSPGSLSPTNSLMGDILLEPEKLKDILAVDDGREKREEEERKAAIIRERNRFWRPLEDGAMEFASERVLPFPAGVECKSPALRLVKSAIDNKNLHAASVLLNSGVLAADPPILPDEVIDWLLDLSVLHPDCALAAAAVNFLAQSLDDRTESFAEIDLDIGTIRRHMMRLGMRDELAGILMEEAEQPGGESKLTLMARNASHRTGAVLRLLEVISMFARHHQVHARDVPKIILALVLLAQDPDTPSETSRAISQAVAATLQAIDAVGKPNRIFRLERDVCLALVDAVAERSAVEALNFVTAVARVDARTARMTRWTALGMLKGPEAIISLTQDEFMGMPNMNLLAKMIQPGNAKERSECKFKVDKVGNTDFKELRKNIGLLSVVLTDLPLYSETPDATENMEQLIRSIGFVSSGITDRSNEDHDRMEAKGEVQHLKIRITYQTSSKGRIDIYTLLTGGSKDSKVQTDLKSFFSSKS